MATFQIFKTIRPSAILPAAGAFDSNPFPLACNEFKQVSFLIAYTPGMAGGAINYKIEFSNTGFTNDWYQIGEFQPPTLTAGADVIIPEQRSSITYQATGTIQENFMSPTFTVAGQFVRITTREIGETGTPGTAAIGCYLRGDA